MKEFLRAIPWKGRDALVVFFVPWILLPVLAVACLQFLAPYYPPVNHFLVALKDGDIKASFALVLLDAASSFLLIGYYLRKYHAGVADLGWRSFSLFKAILYFVIIPIAFGVLVTVALALAQALIPGFNVDQPQTNEFVQGKAAGLQLYSVLALVVLPPIIEETVFRGFMFPAFSKRFGAIVGAVVSSALFGYAHQQGNVGVYTFVLGLLLCFLYYRLGSIYPGMALHMLNNYFAYTALTSK